jgi:hypothetical protein
VIIDYRDAYVTLNLKINGASEKRQISLTKSILKLQEWFRKGKEWTEIEPEINAYMKPIYRLDVHDDGRQFLLEIDCSTIIRDRFGGDVEKFKESIRSIKVE